MGDQILDGIPRVDQVIVIFAVVGWSGKPVSTRTVPGIRHPEEIGNRQPAFDQDSDRITGPDLAHDIATNAVRTSETIDDLGVLPPARARLDADAARSGT